MAPSSRKEGINALIAHYRTKYDPEFSDQDANGVELHVEDSTLQKAFFVSPKISFREGPVGFGISVEANKEISKGTVLMVLPKEERFCLASTRPSTLQTVIDKIKDKFEAKKRETINVGVNHGLCLDDCYRFGDICLAVLIMEALGKDRINTWAWPSLNELKETAYPFWELSTPTNEEGENLRNLLKGTSTLQALEDYKTLSKYSFEEIIKPALQEILTETTETPISYTMKDFVLPSLLQENTEELEALYTTYQYASNLVRSRTHKGISEKDPQVLPLIDLVNGYPNLCSPEINVELGFVWKEQHEGGSPKSAFTLYALRDIPAGDELFISYGTVTASQFAMKYACLPNSLLNYPKVCLDYITLRVPSLLLPPDDLRREAAAKSHFPTTPEELQEHFQFEVSYDALETYKTTGVLEGETPQLKSMRQHLILCHAMDEESVRNNIETGRLTGNYSQVQVGQAHLLVLDHSVTELTSLNEPMGKNNTASNATEREWANHLEATGHYDLAMAYRIRVCQRESYAQWRHAFCKRYQFVSQTSEPSFLYEQLLSGVPSISHLPAPQAPQCLLDSRACPICGHSIRLTKVCPQCQNVHYCSPEHQEMDWNQNGHNLVCFPVSSVNVGVGDAAYSSGEDLWSEEMD